MIWQIMPYVALILAALAVRFLFRRFLSRYIFYQIVKILNLDLLEVMRCDPESFKVLAAEKYQEQETLLKFRALKFLDSLDPIPPDHVSVDHARTLLSMNDTGIEPSGSNIFISRKTAMRKREGRLGANHEGGEIFNPPKDLLDDLKRLVSIRRFCRR